MKQLVPLIAALAAIDIAAAASHDRGTFIQEYDLDRNGSVSKEEFARERERRFAATDSNHDDGLSHDEYVGEYRGRLMQQKPDEKTVARQMRQADVRFKALDSNRDGRISPAEYTHSGWTMFSRHDGDDDGAITAADASKDEPSRSKQAKAD